MNIKRFVVMPLFATSLLAGSGLCLAADSYSSPSPRPGMHNPSMMGDQMMGDQMMKDHMEGGRMMQGCPMMMGQLPPGNEKLAMQMHGEMMKAMGEIMLKYADQIQTAPGK